MVDWVNGKKRVGVFGEGEYVAETTAGCVTETIQSRSNGDLIAKDRTHNLLDIDQCICRKKKLQAGGKPL